MNQSLEFIFKNGILFDVLGVLGLFLLVLAALRLARSHRSWGGTMMTVGAVSLLIARLYVLIAPHLLTNDVLYQIGPIGIALTIALPPLLLTVGLAGVVWGMWGHERWLNEESR